LSLDVKVESQIEIERECVEIFRSRVDTLIEVARQNAFVCAEIELDTADFKSDISRIDLEFECEIILPCERKITFVRIELDEIFRIDLFAGKHAHERCDESLCKVDFYAALINADVGDKTAQNRADGVQKRATLAFVVTIAACHGSGLRAAVALVHKSAEQIRKRDVGKRNVEVVSKVDKQSAYALACAVDARVHQTQRNKNVFHLFGLAHCVDFIDVFVVDFDCDVAVREYVRQVEQTCGREQLHACEVCRVLVGDRHFDVSAVHFHVCVATEVLCRDLGQCDAFRYILFKVYVSFKVCSFF